MCIYTDRTGTKGNIPDTLAGNRKRRTQLSGNYSINEKLKDIAAEYANEPDLPVIDDIHVRDILLDSGVSQERAEAMQQAYKEATQDKPITVNNLIESKTTIALDGVTLQIASDAEGKVRTQNTNGRRYLLIDLDSPEVQSMD